ncbi:MAG: EamA family transporter [Proteobacteria bacterium]|nr:EamA family transporter [Pseudomonadota bacterium]MCZ6785358.1 EamA family transporter [Pseudomonadota bacterium]
MTPFELGIVLLSALLHAAWSVAIKGSRDPLAFNVLQVLPQAAIAVVLCAWIDLSGMPARLWLLLLGTGIAHGLYLYWMSRAYELADLSLVYPIARSTPAFLPLIAVPLLGESLSPLGGLGIAIVVVGIWLVHAAEGLRWRALLDRGTVYAYLTLATTVAYSLFDKSAMADLDALDWSHALPRAVVYYFLIELGCSLVFVPLALRRTGISGLRTTLRGNTLGVLAATGFTLAGYGLILEALRTAPASYVVAARQVSVLFTLGMSALWLGERPGPLRIAGAAGTVAGVILIGVAG